MCLGTSVAVGWIAVSPAMGDEASHESPVLVGICGIGRRVVRVGGDRQQRAMAAHGQFVRALKHELRRGLLVSAFFERFEVRLIID